MAILTLNFATNRNLESGPLQATRFGAAIDERYIGKLRFGRVSANIDSLIIEKYICAKVHGRTGDGEGLANFITKQLRLAHYINTFDDHKPADLTEMSVSPLSAFFEMKESLENKNDVIIYIHGFNVDWYEAVGAAMALEIMLNHHSNSSNKSVFLFTWPSDGALLKSQAYRDDRQDARDSALAIAEGFLSLRAFLHEVKIEPIAQSAKRRKNLHLLCHSMGNYLLQHTLAKLIEIRQSEDMPKLFNHVFMCAPDVDHDIFTTNSHMVQLPKICQFITIYYNSGDIAMVISDLTKGNPKRLGHKGVSAPEQLPSKLHQVDCSDIIGGITEHSYYLWATVNHDIALSLDDIAFDDNERYRTEKRNNCWQLD